MEENKLAQVKKNMKKRDTAPVEEVVHVVIPVIKPNTPRNKKREINLGLKVFRT